jgi:hypothetical protein
MKLRTYFTYDAANVLPRVIIIAPRDTKEVFVYCPPIDGQDPWIDQVDDFEAAERLASSLIMRTGQRTVLVTTDIVDWWKSGLTALEKT